MKPAKPVKNKQGTPSRAALEPGEPSAGSGPVPIWLIIICGLLFFWGQVYLDAHSGGFSSQVYEPFRDTNHLAMANPIDEAQQDILKGKNVYAVYCLACHQANGMGAPGVAPPLAGSEWVLMGPNRLVRIPNNGLSGPITVKGQEFNLNMLPIGATLTDEELAASLTYIRQEWGNKGGRITPAQVRAVREAVGGRATDGSAPWTGAELLALPDNL